MRASWTWWTGEDSNPRSSQGAAGLQPAAIDRSATCPKLILTAPVLGGFLISQQVLAGSDTNPRLGSLHSRANRSPPSGCNKNYKPLCPILHAFYRPALSAGLAARLLQLGAGEGIRTPDPLITNQMLYQLSYASGHKLPIIVIRTQNCNRLNKRKF